TSPVVVSPPTVGAVGSVASPPVPVVVSPVVVSPVVVVLGSGCASSPSPASPAESAGSSGNTLHGSSTIAVIDASVMPPPVTRILRFLFVAMGRLCHDRGSPVLQTNHGHRRGQVVSRAADPDLTIGHGG